MRTPEPIEPLAPEQDQPPQRSFFQKFFTAIVIALVFAVGRSLFSAGGASASDGWMNDWDKAVAQSKASGKPALVLFTADWCPSCRRLESEVLSQDDFKSFLKENFTLVKVDLSDRNGPNNERAANFGVQAIPTLILYNRDSKELGRTNEMPAPLLKAWLQNGGRLGVR